VVDVTDAGGAADAAASTEAEGLPRPEPFEGLTDLLTTPDHVEAFAVSPTDQLDGPPSSPARIAGYRILSKLHPPSKRFITELASILLAPPDHFMDAEHVVRCPFADHGQVGLRFTRGADVVELSLIASCPGIHIQTSTGPRYVQLKPDLLGPLVGLMRATYPGTFR